MRRNLLSHLLAGAAAVFALGIGMAIAPPARGQILHVSGPRPSFEVATIKLSKPDETVSGMGFSDGGHVFLSTNSTLRDLIQEGYNVKSTSEILGATGWMTTAKFDVAARLDDAEYTRLQGMAMENKIPRIRLMVQSLLAERFGLKVEFAMRESSFFVLVQAKGGSKLKLTAMAPADPNGVNTPHPLAGPTLQRNGVGQIEATGVSMALLADTLARMPELGSGGGFTMGDLVVDKTGLSGSYDWSLNWAPLSQTSGDVEADTSRPALFTAVREQLGLRLDRTKGPVEVVVIDRVERTSAN